MLLGICRLRFLLLASLPLIALPTSLLLTHLINQLAQYNYNSNYVYFARHIQLHKLNIFFDRYSFAGVLNGHLQKYEDAPLSAKLNISKGFLKQLQDGHVYKS